MDDFTFAVESPSFDHQVKKVLEQLQHPCTPSLCAALKTTRQALREGNYDVSLEWVQVPLDFTWEQLNSGNWKDVDVTWRELYSTCTFLKAVGLVKRGEWQAALLELDRGILMGAPILNNVLHSFARALTAEIQACSTETVSGEPSVSAIPQPEHTSATQVEHQSCAISHERKRQIVFRNYKQFQQSNTSPSAHQSDPSEPTIVEITSPKRLKTATLNFPLFDPSRRIPTTHCPSLEAFHQQYMVPSTPVVITGAMDLWPAYAAKKWRYVMSVQRSFT